MTTIIKSDDMRQLSRVRALDSRQHDEQLRFTEDSAVIQGKRIAELEARLEDSSEKARKLGQEIEASYRRGVEEGRQQGLASAADNQQERLEILSGHIMEARAEFTECMAATERLAVILVRECLNRLFADPDHRSGLVVKLLRAQLEHIERHSIISIAVSPEDFSGEKWDEFACHLFPDSVNLKRDGSIPPGGCRIKLRLGEIEVGLNQQWDALASLLSELATAEPVS